MKEQPFKEYIIEKEPDKAYKASTWKTAIGLQDVDGLKPSEYLISLANRNIEGHLSSLDVISLVESYYRESEEVNVKEKEADLVSSRINQLLQSKSFTFSSEQLISIHSYLFKGIYPHAGIIRDYNITKSEWVLDQDSVIYGNFYDLRQTLDYDIYQEKHFSYKDLNTDQVIEHIARFISDLWQIHPFGEGNTRTVAVFLIKYLRTLGYKDIANDIFYQNSWYFRNALVRANYTNIDKNIYATTKYLELLLRNLILKEHNELKYRYLHISYKDQDNED